MVFDAIARQTAAIEDEPDEARARPRLGRVQQALLPAPLAGAGAGGRRGATRRRPAGPRVARSLPDRYVLIAPVLFLLLRRRFSTALSAVLAVACTLAPPVYKWSLGMRVDSWGLLLETLGLLAAVLVKDRGRGWLALRVVADRGAVDHPRRHGDPGAGRALAARRRVARPGRRRTNAMLLGTGVVAALPAFVLGGTPVRDNLAYVIAGYNIPDESSWSYVASGYLDQLWRTISWTSPTRSTSPSRPRSCSTRDCAAAAALIALVARPSRGDPYFALMKASLPGCVLLLLLANNPQAYRLELVFVPMAAVGLAILAVRLVAARYPRVTA